MVVPHASTKTTKTWRTVLPADLAGRALDVALTVAERLRDSGPAHDIESDAGCAVLYGQLDRYVPDQGWAAAAHGCLTPAATAAAQADTGYVGLFGGLSGVAFAAHSLSQRGTRYGRLLAELDKAIAASATSTGQAIARNPRGLPFRVFDVISGAAGIGAYLLCRPESEAALHAVLTGLVALCGEDNGFPNWHTPFDAMSPTTPMAQSFPTGVFNAGLAHGVPGPLTLLALAEQAGISVAGQPEAIELVARWLLDNRADDEWGPSWPSGFPMPAEEVSKNYGPTHNAWCYGSPGVARSLWLAGKAIGDDATQRLAVDAMAAVSRRPGSARRVDSSPGLCHGVAGLLQINLRFAQETGDAVFVDAAGMFTAMLLDLYEPERKFGYGSLTEDGTMSDEPGLLDGAAGVALALLAAGTEVAPEWDRILLLA